MFFVQLLNHMNVSRSIGFLTAARLRNGKSCCCCCGKSCCCCCCRCCFAAAAAAAAADAAAAGWPCAFVDRHEAALRESKTSARIIFVFLNQSLSLFTQRLTRRYCLLGVVKLSLKLSLWFGSQRHKIPHRNLYCICSEKRVFLFSHGTLLSFDWEIPGYWLLAEAGC